MNAIEAQVVADFIKNNVALCEKIRVSIGDIPISIYYKIATNDAIFRRYLRDGCKKYIDVYYALEDMADNEILIFISEIQLYGLFAPEKYIDFMNNIRGACEENSVISSSFQIVLNSARQKLVFLCVDVTNACANSTTAADKVAKMAGDCFGAAVSVTAGHRAVEITVDKVIDGSDREDQFYQFLDYIQARDRDVADCISLPRIFTARRLRYTIPKLTNDIYDLKSLILALKTAANVTINGSITINNNSYNNTTITSTDAASRVSIDTKKWINMNHPRDRESAGEYYRRYAAEIPNAMSNSYFGRIVKSLGVVFIKNNNVRYWKVQ